MVNIVVSLDKDGQLEKPSPHAKHNTTQQNDHICFNSYILTNVFLYFRSNLLTRHQL